MALHEEWKNMQENETQVRHYPFMALPLSYPYDAMEPKIDTLTMKLHHDRHYTTYVTNLNKALKDWPHLHNWSLERLIVFNKMLPASISIDVEHNAGGVYNHENYFKALLGIGTDFVSLKQEMKQAALSVFGSGYAWLCSDRNGKGCVVTTANQETPLTLGLTPIVCVDVWEHAYYLKHYNKRDDYFEDWWTLVFRTQS